MKSYQVIFQPGDQAMEVQEGSTIMEAMDQAGINFDFPCGGQGKCGKCRVRVPAGAGDPTATEKEILEPMELDRGIRLACAARVHGHMTVELPERLQHNILMASGERTCRIEPHLKKIFVQVAEPSLEAQRSDWHRLKDSLAGQGYNSARLEIPVALLRRLPETIRRAGHGVTVVMYGSKIEGLEEHDTTPAMLGMAFDIGTTTIVGYLLDLYSGRELCAVSTLNPQTRFGADVISRITFANREEGGLEKLHAAVLGAINKLIGEALEKAGAGKEQIYGVSVAANTCMHHLFLGINPGNIAVAPYVAAVSEPVVAGAAELGIDINPAGKIFVLPNIAGFVGADTTAVLLAAETDRSTGIKLVIDIGTNGEIALGSGERMVACSAAAGPAFEGAQISSGMRGAAGAIDHVQFEDNLAYTVIGGGRPLGICGSALLDTVAGLLELGMINKRGKLLPPGQLTAEAARFKDCIVEHEGQPAFVLAGADKTGHGRPVTVTQGDIRELQLAKGAIAAGIRVLMQTLGVELDDIQEVLLAGAFGNYLNPHSACAIGLIPSELEGKITMIGNAAGTGAKLALLSSSEFRRAAQVAESVEFVELGSYPGFNSIFAANTYFNPKTQQKGKKVAVKQ
ncbi:ASKHA domain-containing protein [Desulfoscipio gibsoniae]|uniref:Putative metal-binding protein n=1 Tax=Desulfoscipio gibsoniae DSM 7213 TaxID=767817 RepID=R4KCE1_9FIRM|nr:ASKHA domain-containing protein [Desulfoscipio gibsoniae]AGL00239.1 putative metal-binding protein [Desulfoscipio gibsoniae DSM 7213]